MSSKTYLINQDYNAHLEEFKKKSVCEKIFLISWGFLSMSFYKVYFYCTDNDKYEKYVAGIAYVNRLNKKLQTT